MKGVEYKGCNSVDGPIIVVRRSENIFYGEIAAVRDRFGAKKIGRVIDVSEEYAIVQIFGSTTGLDLDETTLEFLETPMELRVGEGLLGRIFNGLGQPIDGYKDIISSKKVNVNGYPINPYARVYPRDFIQTGISSIDGMNTLIRGQKLPIFSGNGLPHNKLAAQIIRQAKIRNSDEQFVMVFAGMGIKYDVAEFFKRCDLVISLDSGSTHLAWACEKPKIVSIFCSTPKGFYAPVGSENKYIALSGELSCQPCHKKHCPIAEKENGCTFLPSPKEVLDSVEKLLS